MQPARIEVGRVLTTKPGSLDWIPSEQVSGGSKWGGRGLPEKIPLKQKGAMGLQEGG